LIEQNVGHHYRQTYTKDKDKINHQSELDKSARKRNIQTENMDVNN